MKVIKDKKKKRKVGEKMGIYLSIIKVYWKVLNNLKGDGGCGVRIQMRKGWVVISIKLIVTIYRNL